MTTSVETLLSNINDFRYNPAGIQSSVLSMLSDLTSGAIDIVDPTNPVVFTLESAAVMTAGFMVESKRLNRQQYAYAAQTPDDLYPHMSDKDYVDVFAVPATAPILFVINKNELINNLVSLNDGSGVSKLVIPRNTTVTVSDMTFSLQYPIEIRQMAHGGLRVVYNTDQTTPLQTLTSNIIAWGIVRDGTGEEYLTFEVAMSQFDIISKTAAVNSSQPLIVKIPIADSYYYTRVWVDNADGTFTELQTTYTDAVYDYKTITAVIKVTDSTVTVKIPSVYINSGLLNKSIRIDVYETKGEMNVNLANYKPEQYETKFIALNKAEIDAFVSPLQKFKSIYTYSTKYATGGNAAMTFDALRTRVVTNAMGDSNIPITNVQIESSLNREGYTVVKNIDYITNRAFLATRAMPDPTDTNLITPISAGMGMLSARVRDAQALTTTIDNGDGFVLLTPDTLYRWNSGILQFVSSSEVTALKALSVDQLSLAISNNNYMYSPFHYVLDSSQNEFNLRPYYLDNPSVVSKSFIAENETTLLQVSTNEYVISRTSTGYKLHIQTSSSAEFIALSDSEVAVQLAYIPPDEVNYAYVLGTLVGKDSSTGERVYEFDLPSNFSIDTNHYLGMTSFQMYDTTSRVVKMPLDTTFTILYSTSSAMGNQWTQSTIDPLLGAFQLPTGSKAITQEQININFGYYLEHLWARSRTVVSSNQYATWDVDVPATYTQDVYQADPATGLAFTIVNGELVYTKLHSAGDPVLDGNGEPVYKYRKGDIKVDAYNNPIVTQSRELLRQMDLFMLDATYYFATNDVAVSYRQEIVNTVVDWLTVDMPSVNSGLLEETEIYFHPTTAIGSVDVMYGAGLTTTINAGQSFTVDLTVPASVYDNSELIDSLTNKTISTISTCLKSQTVAISDIIDALRTAYSDDVLSVEISKLGGAAALSVVTVIDNSQRLSLNKKLIARNDNTLAVVEDVNVNFTRYEMT